jgi:hypothetical protein
MELEIEGGKVVGHSPEKGVGLWVLLRKEETRRREEGLWI